MERAHFQADAEGRRFDEYGARMQAAQREALEKQVSKRTTGAIALQLQLYLDSPNTLGQAPGRDSSLCVQ